MNLRLPLICTIVCISYLGIANPTGKVQYFSGTLNDAFQSAAAQSKMSFVYFHAEWCVPCQIMDETTFNDQFLADYLMQQTIPIKINVEDTEYGTLRFRYNIRTLPTLLVFDNEGNMLLRTEEMLSASKLMYGFAQIEKETNTPPTQQLVAATPNSVVFIGNTPPTTTLQKYTPIKNTTTDPQTKEQQLKLVESKITAYGVQISLYDNPTAANNHLQLLSEKTDQAYIETTKDAFGKPIYRILIGKVPTEAEALELREKFRLIGIDGGMVRPVTYIHRGISR
jgi:cell division septation protein DedD